MRRHLFRHALLLSLSTPFAAAGLRAQESSFDDLFSNDRFYRDHGILKAEGDVGFLADLSPDELVRFLPNIVTGDYRVTSHLMFECEAETPAGRIAYGFPGLGPSLGMIRDGRIRALAVITKNRSPLLPDLPVLSELVPGFDRDATHGLLAPAGTPRAIRAKIAKDVATVLELPEVKQQMTAMAFEPGPTTPEEYEKLIRGMIEMFGKIAVNAGLRAP